MHPLTDAFIKGRAKLKKTENKYFDKQIKPKKACHVGALLYGWEGFADDLSDVLENPDNAVNRIKLDFPFLYSHFVPLPCDDTPEKEGQILSILIHLNDDHDGRSGWTDQKVAEWLETAISQAQA